MPFDNKLKIAVKHIFLTFLSHSSLIETHKKPINITILVKRDRKVLNQTKNKIFMYINLKILIPWLLFVQIG